MLAAITKAGTSDCVRETSHPSLWKHAPIREVFYFFFFSPSLSLLVLSRTIRITTSRSFDYICIKLELSAYYDSRLVNVSNVDSLNFRLIDRIKMRYTKMFNWT